MKIGILTFHRAHNYGAVLQAYALKIFLSNPGNEVKIIDYWPDYRKGMYDLIDWSYYKSNAPLFSKIKRIIINVLCFPENLIRFSRFQNFIKNELRIHSKKNIYNDFILTEKFDLFIFGSDQIWRYNNFKKFQGFDPIYWGKVPVNVVQKKISYAASMGVMEINEKQKDFIKEHLKEFDSISVRESKLKEIIQPLTDKNIFEVLDPVFLLNREQWNKLVSNKKKKTEKYVLFYHLVYSEDADKFAKIISKKLGCKIIEINGNVRPLKNPYKFKQYIGPLNFIELFLNASFVISTSFHGVAFSIIFQKQFYALGMNNNSSRVQNLLAKLGIENRLLTNYNVIEDKDIDFKRVNSLIELEIEKSKDFIIQNIT